MAVQENHIRPLNLKEEQKKRFKIDIDNIGKRLKEFVYTNCPACDLNNYNFKFEKYNFTYVECKNCHSLYVNPRPTPEILNWYYKNSENYKFWNKFIFPQSEKSRVENIFKPRLKRVLNICDKEKVNKDLFLEVGPGFGTFGKLMKDENYFKRYIAVEPMPDLAKSCRKKGLDVIEKNIEDINLKKNKASVIAFFEVIEHLYSPKNFLVNLKKLLKKNGLLFITCPNFHGFEVQTLGKVSDTVDIEHLNYFNISSLSKLLENSGYLVVESFTPGVLDLDIVLNKIKSKEFKIDADHFLNFFLKSNHEKSSVSFQKFLIENKLSSHMWIVAKNL